MRAKPLLHYVASALLLPLAIALPAAAQQRVGVNAAVNTDANGFPPGGAVRKLVIGQEVVHNERIVTDAKGQTQVLFLDGSSVSVGPNADLLIDDFVYDPSTGTGKMSLTVVQGAMRFIGGKLSKQEGAVSVHVGSSIIGVRGGVFVADVQPGGKTEVIFVFGKDLKVAGQSGCAQDLYRSGFEVDISGSGGCPNSPHEAPPGATQAILGQLDGRPGGSGGATTVPTDATIARSPVPNTISNNIQASVQQAAQNSAPVIVALTTPTVSPPQVPTNQIQITSSQTQPAVSNPPSTTPTSTPIPPPQPVVVQIAGLVKIAPQGSTLGFTNQSANARIPYTGSITYPAGSGMQDGVATGADSAGTVVTVSPLTAGATTNVTATASSAANPATGTVTTSADGDFFYGNLTVTASGQQIFIMGGTPVAQSFYAPTSTPQFYAFTVQPDAILGANGQAQTIPFLPAAYGGTMANAAVSPLYLVTRANSPFGSYNANADPNGTSAGYLQASLAVNGQGANQSSALVITTGSFDTSNSGTIYGAGPLRGTVFQSATGPLVSIASAVTTVPDANGNVLFGNNTIDGFVLDQNDYNDGNFSQSLASAFSYASGGNSTTTNYAFNQPVTATTLPTGVGTSRSALTETGYFGGIMECCSTNGIVNYALTGTTTVQTFPSDNRVAATFAGGDPFTASQSGLNSVTLQFGSNTTGLNYARSTFIDDNTYAATENPNVASQISTTSGGTETLPTYPSGSTLYPRLAMVTAAALGPSANSWMPAGVTPCTCQYLQWGYWTGHIYDNVNATQTSNGRNDIGAINTWIAGQPTVTMPTVGSGTYSGAAVGTVFNNGATYLAAGNFSNTFNFGNNTGALSITNFDGANYSGSVAGKGNAYAGAITGGTNRTGSVSGGFYGPGAAETGGGFAVHATSGPNYIASGIFAGALTGPIH